MARRRRSDRDVRSSAGAREFYRASGTLPREVNRDFEHSALYSSAAQAVYPILRGSVKRQPARYVTTRVFPARFGTLPPAKQRRAFFAASKAVRIGDSYRPQLKELPYRVRECVKRKDRREVLFAFRRAGFSGSAPKRSYRRTLFSQYGC